MDKTESILLFCMGIGAMIHLLTSMRKTRGFVQKNGSAFMQEQNRSRS